MRKFSKKQYLVAGVAAAAIVGLGTGTAIAYWSTTGGGSGSGNVASSNGTLILHASFPDGLTPGGSVPVTYTAENDNSSSGYVHTLTVTSLSVDSGHSACVLGDFHTTVDVPTGGVQVPANTPAPGTQVATGQLSMDDTTASQDACKGANITLNLSSS